MTREKDFEKAAMDYCEDHSHCIYFEFGAEYGYQYAIEKAQQWIDDNVLEFKGESFVHDFKDCLQDFRRAME